MLSMRVRHHATFSVSDFRSAVSFASSVAPSPLKLTMAFHMAEPEVLAKRSQPFASWLRVRLPWYPRRFRNSRRSFFNGAICCSTAAIAASSPGKCLRHIRKAFRPSSDSSMSAYPCGPRHFRSRIHGARRPSVHSPPVRRFPASERKANPYLRGWRLRFRGFADLAQNQIGLVPIFETNS